VHRWKYAQDYGQALWDVIKVLVEDLRKDLITRHEVVLQKQRGARLHTWIMANKFNSVRHVPLILPTQGTSKPTVALADMATVRPIDNITAEVPPAHFYASSPKKQVLNRHKRKATEQLQSAESLKRRKEAVRFGWTLLPCPLNSCLFRTRKICRPRNKQLRPNRH
jgi:hypothetical protein